MVLGLLTAAAAATVRASRLAMGTVVGITVDTAEGEDATPAIEAAYAAIEAGEAALSEWRPESATSRIARGETVPLAAASADLYGFVRDLRARSDGAFDPGWRSGAQLRQGSEGWSADGALDLGGVLKGWLNDRAGEALRAHGVHDFLIDAAGDVLAAGEGPDGRGWTVDVWDGSGRVATVRLRDQALSTSGNAGQPGHVVDARTGVAVVGERLVSVVAPSGMLADGLATALFAGAPPRLAETYGAWALVIDAERRGSVGARAVFRRIPGPRPRWDRPAQPPVEGAEPSAATGG